jgi:hypothetical protein
LGRSAADAGSAAVLACLQQQGMLATDAAALTMLLDIAGMHSRLAAAQWLRQQGAEWPSRFNWFPWKNEVLAWARAEGCTTPTRSA